MILVAADAGDYDVEFEEMLADAMEGVLSNLSEADQLALIESDGLDEKVSEAVRVGINAAAEVLAKALKECSPPMLADRSQRQQEFKQGLAEHWRKAFDLYEMTVTATREMGEFWYDKHVPPDGVQDWTLDALSRLLARAVRISEEVLVLLKSGFGQAASARWRALHEVAVIANFIETHGDACAERYLLHSDVEILKGMREHNKHAARLGFEPQREDVIAAYEETVKSLTDRFGKAFSKDFGWAQPDMARQDPRFGTARITFADIEKSVEVDHNRPLYRRASYHVHAQPLGVLWSPDAPEVDGREMLLTGPSPMGLAEPGAAALISLVATTASALASKKCSATAWLITTLMLLSDEAEDAFHEAEQAVMIAREPESDGSSA